MKTIRLLSIIMLLLTSSKAFAYEKARFSLDDAVKYARKNHPKILIAQNKIGQQRETLKSVKMLNPNISFHGGYNVMQDREYFGVSISQGLDSIFDYKKNLNKAKLDLENTIYESELVTQEVVKEVREAYSEYNSKHNLLKLKLKSLNLRRKEFRLAAKKFEKGKISMDEYLSKKQLLESATHEVKESKISFDTSRERLYSKMGCGARGFTAPLPVRTSDATSSEADLSQKHATAKGDRE